MAGKDVGLGMFGQEIETVLSGGIRIAQFASHSSVDMRARPDLHFNSATFHISGLAYTKFNFGPYFHTYHAYENAARKFQGVGPSISWSGSAPLIGDQGGGLGFDWGANVALLFGRQKTTVRHQETGRY
jgi:hypothetical protein